MQSARVAEHDEGGIELSDLVQQEVLYHKSYEVTLVVLNVLPSLHHLGKPLSKRCVPHWEDVDVLVEVFPTLPLVQLLRTAVVVLGVEHQSLHPSQCAVVLTHSPLRKALKECLGVSEHEFLEESAGVDARGVGGGSIRRKSILLGEADIEQVLLEVPSQLEVIFTLVAIEVDEDDS